MHYWLDPEKDLSLNGNITIKTIKQKIVILLLFDHLQAHALALYDNMTSKTIK